MIVIKNAKAMQFDPPKVWDDIDIVIDGSVIVDAGQGIAGNYSPEKVIDGSGKLVYPGLVCSHHHYYSGLSRGVLAEIGPTPDFVSTLKTFGGGWTGHWMRNQPTIRGLSVPLMP